LFFLSARAVVGAFEINGPPSVDDYEEIRKIGNKLALKILGK
jgi:hypothetical protein